MATQLFISHITEEAGIAATLKARITDDFQVRLAIFLSSDTESIAAGDEWLTSVGAAVRNSAVFIVICTPVSVTRPWVNFEAGAAWMRDIPVIPVCAGGMRPRGLPMPLAARQGLDLGDAQGLRRLYGRIADAVDCRLPDRDYEALAAELSATAAGRRPAGQGGVAPDNDKAIGRDWTRLSAIRATSGARLTSWPPPRRSRWRPRRKYSALMTGSGSAGVSRVT